MSVFNDFQRLWMERFPQSSLSDAWERDVRASLDRHKQRIQQLSTELEQETLYVEYLERLLSDVEKYRKSGKDPSDLLEANATASIISQHGGQHQAQLQGSSDDESMNAFPNDVIDDVVDPEEEEEEVEKVAEHGREENAQYLDRDLDLVEEHNSLKARINLLEEQQQKHQHKQLRYGKRFNVNDYTGTTETNNETIEKKFGTNDQNIALHQCINELASTLDEHKKNLIPTSDIAVSSGGSISPKVPRKNSGKSLTTSASTASTNFVTVIEVKENKSTTTLNKNKTSYAEDGHEENENNTDNNLDTFGEDEETPSRTKITTTPTTKFSTFDKKNNETPTSVKLRTNIPSSSMINESNKKKMPPRPPPKQIRRIEPPIVPSTATSSPPSKSDMQATMMTSSANTNTFSSSSSSDSPGNSLDRNVKPSDILRQKSAENTSDVKAFAAANRKTIPDSTMVNRLATNPELLEELGNKIKKSEANHTERDCPKSSSLERSKVLGSRSANNATISSDMISSNISSTAVVGSLEKSSTAVASGYNSRSKQQERKNSTTKSETISPPSKADVVRSYESISSNSTDSTRTANEQNTVISGGAVNGALNEHLYDSVATDNGDAGEYAYVKPSNTCSSGMRCGGGYSSSRDNLSTNSGSASGGAPGDADSNSGVSNYVNIDYFIHQRSNETRPSSVDSDGETDNLMPIMRSISHDEQAPHTPGVLRKNLVSAILVSGYQRGAKIRSILNIIIQSETIYVACLNTMIQYKKAIHATLGTSQPVIKQEEENTIFFKIEELYEAHSIFLSELKGLVSHDGGDILIGELFKRLAEMVDLYGAFLHNYNQAIETVKKCSANNPQFKKIVSTIVLNLQTEQSLTLEDLLHKPVARVQINALVFNDLMECTPANHPDYNQLKYARDTIQSFFKSFNVVDQNLSSDSNKNLRRMVKNSFIVELVDGHRKLRHLFLFNDVIACAKYKANGRDRIDYELKWFMMLKDVNVIEDIDTNNSDLKESSPANILQLKTQACSVRDQLLMEEREDTKGGSRLGKPNGFRAGDKYRRKLADLESQLVLASPNLVFRIINRSTNKTATFFLSSDYERSQWIDSIHSLQQTCKVPNTGIINALEIHSFIVAIQKNSKTEMGSYLMRDTHDESLLVGDLHMTVHNLIGLEQASDLYLCIEIDSYGHYFRKATTKMACRSTNPVWNESFVVELEGSQNVRFLLYEAKERVSIKSIYVLKLSRSWLQQTTEHHDLKFTNGLILNISLRFVPAEVTLRRVPTSKPGALFGAKMQQVLKREKRDIPFLISACIREVERRGMFEVGIYRVSGSASDLAKLKKSFETNAYEAEQLLKDVDIHSVTGILKSYLRELPEALFTDALYPKFFETFSRYSNNNESERIRELLLIFDDLPAPNKASIHHILDHLIRVHHRESDNKMSLHNLAMVFGPTLLRPGITQSKQKDLLASSTVDVMAQAGILYSFLQSRIKYENNN